MTPKAVIGGLVVAFVAALGAAVPAAAVPAAAAGQFGEHVSTCARTTGFDAEHNPGMHRGHAGWTPDHAC